MPYFVSGGRRLYYEEKGTGDLLLLLPGDTSAAAHHGGELDYFSRRYRVVCLDFWGTGRSERADDWPPNWWEIGVEDACTLIETLAQGPAIILGQSGGAAIALMLGIRHPQLVRAIVSDSQVERLPPDWLDSVVAQRQGTVAPATTRFWEIAHGPDWAQVVTADDGAIRARAKAGGIDWFHGDLKRLSCPVLLTGSLSDRLMPDLPGQMLAMARQIPDCRLYVATGGGHPFMWTRPEEFRRVVDFFLETALT